MSMRTIKSDLESSRFPLKVGLQPSPSWKRKTATVPGPGSGPRQRRSEKLDAELLKLKEKAQGNSDKGDS